MGPLPNETNCECWLDNVTKCVGNLCLVLFNGQDISIRTLGESQNWRHVRTQNGFNLLFTVIICNYFLSVISIILIPAKGFHPQVTIYAKSRENPCHFGTLQRNEELISCTVSVFWPCNLSSRTFHRQLLTFIQLFTKSFRLEIPWNTAVILIFY